MKEQEQMIVQPQSKSSWSTAFASVTSVSFQKESKIHAPLRSFVSYQHLKSVNLREIILNFSNTEKSWMLSVVWLS